MPQAPFQDVLSYLRRVCAAEHARDLPDSQLLERYQAQREETAFAVLVRRHGPMVLGVCQRLIGDAHAAEDAFQGTFLVLARRAGSIRKKASVGSWLYGVARRVAAKAKAETAARRNRERRVVDMPGTEPLDELTWQELRSVLDEEIGRLPEKYRAPIVLCYLEGKSYDLAARDLGWAKGTLARRLGRARDLLRQQLTRRGLALSAGVLATALGEKALAAPVAALLTIRTVKAAMSFAAGKAVATGCVSAGAVALAEEVIRGTVAYKATLVVIALVLGFSVGGAGLAGYARLNQGEQPAQAEAKAIQPAKIGQTRKQEKQAALPTDLYGDPLPEGALARLGTARFRHDSRATTDVAFSPDGKVLASAGLIGLGVCLWDAATGRPLHQLSVPYISASLAFSPDGKLLFTGGKEGLFIDVATGKEVRRLEASPRGQVNAVAFSPDGRMVAVAGRSPGRAEVVFFDAATGKELRRVAWDYKENVNNGNVPKIAFSPDGKILASAGIDKIVRLWEAETGKEIQRLKGHQKPVWSVAFAPGGKVLASAGEDDHIRLWDLEKGLTLQRLKTDDLSIYTVLFSPDGKWLASGGLGGNSLWDPETGKEVRKWQQVAGVLAFSPDGKVLASAGWSDDISIHRWDTSTGMELGSASGHTGRIVSLCYGADGKELFSLSSDRRAARWDVSTGREQSQLFGGRLGKFENTWWMRDGALSPDGKLAAVAGSWTDPADPVGVKRDAVIHLFDNATGKELRTLEGHNDWIDSLKFSLDGKLMASIGRDATHIWNVTEGKQLYQLPVKQNVLSRFAFSRDSKVLAYATENGTVYFLEAATGKKLREWDNGQSVLYNLVVSPDGNLIASISPRMQIDGKDQVRIWATASGKHLLSFEVAPSVKHAFFSATGRIFGVASSSYRTLDRGDLEFVSLIHIYETLSGQEIRKFEIPQKWISSLAISPDDQTLATGGGDSTILLWDLTGLAKNAGATAVPLTAEDLDSLWSDLAGEAPRADRAHWRFALAPKQSLPFLKAHLQPLAPAAPDQVAKLVADLDSERFAVRQDAAQTLEKMGEAAEAALRKVLEGNPNLEVRQRLRQILEKRDQEAIRKLRAIEALEQIGTAEPRQVLQMLANAAPNPRVAEAGRAALERLAKQAAR